ncbi:hypothetical protein ES703_115374 [subsurface metagenome]
MARREFVVPRKGIGKPDFYKTSAPTRSVLGEPQQKWYCLYYGEIDALSFVTVPVYTGAPGWHLYFGGGIFSVNAEVIASATVLIQMPELPYIEVIDYYWKLQGAVTLQEPAIVIIEPDENMQVKLYNLDEGKHTFSMTLLGMEEKC